MEAIRAFGPKLGSKLSIRSQKNIFPACKLSRFPTTSSPGKPPKLVPLKATTNTLSCEDEENRKFKKLAPSEWGHQFLDAHVDVSEMDSLGREIAALKPKVGDLFMSFNGVDSIKNNIHFIYLLVSLGLAYHFEDEIEENLKKGFRNIEELLSSKDDLYTVSIIFWVFRTYGHNVSSDIFKRFKGDNGKFKEFLTEDAKGILSFYEAAHMGTTADYILDEALSFTLSYLELLAASGTCSLHLSRRIQNALGQPQHKNMEILVAGIYPVIRTRRCLRQDTTQVFQAKLQIPTTTLPTRTQSPFKVSNLLNYKWYKEKDFESKLPPYYRDKFVEMHLVTLAYFEPKYSRVRIMLTKMFTIEIILDDTCDRYASLREIENLANAIERWDLDDIMDGQPDYLKFVVNFIFETFQEFERELASELGGSYSLKATIDDCKRLTRANLEVAKWAEADHVPMFEEYIEVAGVEVAAYFTIAGVLMAMKNICKEEAYEWLKSRDKVVRLISTVAKVLNDIRGFEDDMSIGYVMNSINCYKKQYGVTEEEAFRKLHQIVANAHQMINEELLKKINGPRQVLKAICNLGRMVNVSYEIVDEFTHPDGKFKNHITSVYLDV